MGWLWTRPRAVAPTTAWPHWQSPVCWSGTAFGLGLQNEQYLIGKAAPQQLREDISRLISSTEGVDSVLELLTMRLSPDQVLVAARVDLADHLSPEELEHAADEVDQQIRGRYPEVRYVFLDPTPDSEES